MKRTPLEIISKSAFCQSYLYIAGFLTDSEAEKVNGRIRKYQDKHRQNVSYEDLGSVRVVTSAEIERLNQRITELEKSVTGYERLLDTAYDDFQSCGDNWEVRDVLRDLIEYAPRRNWKEVLAAYENPIKSKEIG